MIGIAQLFDGGGESEVEIRKVNRDQRLRFFRSRRMDEPIEDGKRLGNDANRLDEAGHAEPAIVGEQLSPAGHQALTAEAENGGVGLPTSNFYCEGAGV